MRNKAGVGPAAVISVTTTEKPEVRHDDEMLKLIIVSSNQILMQGPQYFYEQPNFIYNSSEVITGIGIHVAKKLLFITDESRAIYMCVHTQIIGRNFFLTKHGYKTDPVLNISGPH